MSAPEAPGITDPAVFPVVPAQGKRKSHHPVEPLGEQPAQAGAFHGVLQATIEDVDVFGQGALLPQVVEAVLVACDAVSGCDAEDARQRLDKTVGSAGVGVAPVRGRRQQSGVLPDGPAIVPPQAGERPAWQGFPRVPLSLTVVQHAAGSKAVPETSQQHFGPLALVGAQGRGIPLCTVHVVDGHEGRLPAHGEAHVPCLEFAVHFLAQGEYVRPLLVGVGEGHAGILVDPRDLVGEVKGHLCLAGGAGYRGSAHRVGGARQGDVTLAGEQPRSGVEADPSGAGHEHLGPGVEVGEILLGTRRAVEGFDVGRQLYQVA